MGPTSQSLGAPAPWCSLRQKIRPWEHLKFWPRPGKWEWSLAALPSKKLFAHQTFHVYIYIYICIIFHLRLSLADGWNVHLTSVWFYLSIYIYILYYIILYYIIYIYVWESVRNIDSWFHWYTTVHDIVTLPTDVNRQSKLQGSSFTPEISFFQENEYLGPKPHP